MYELNSRRTSVDGIGLVEVRLGWIPAIDNHSDTTVVQLFDEDETLIGEATIQPHRASDAFEHPMVYVAAA